MSRRRWLSALLLCSLALSACARAVPPATPPKAPPAAPMTQPESAPPEPTVTDVRETRQMDVTPVELDLGKGGLLVLEVATGKTWRLPGFWPQFSWSPDSETLLFSPQDQPSYLFNLASGQFMRLPDGITGAGFSPDGRFLGVELAQSGQSRLGLLDLVSQTATLLPAETRWVSWSPNGDGVAYATEAPCDVYVAEPDGTGTHKVSDRGGTCEGFYWSPSGTSLLVETTGNEPVLIDLQKPEVASLPVGAATTFRGWAKGGTTAAFVVNTEAGPALGLFDLTTGTQERIPLGENEFNVSLSPDGTRLLSRELHCSAEPNRTHVRDLQSGQDLAFVIPALEGWYWAPDGERFAASGTEGLLLVDPESASFRVVIPKADEFIHIHRNPWSPDGRYLAVWMGGGHGGGCD